MTKHGWILGLAVVLGSAGFARAQDDAKAKAKAAAPEEKGSDAAESKETHKGLWVATGGGLELIYDDNVFLEDRSDRRAIETVPQANNRFSLMHQADDFILHGYGRVDLHWQGIAGKEAMFRLEPGGHGYWFNTTKSYDEFKAEFVHEAWDRGEVFLKGAYIPRRFDKNYFSGGIDGNADGDIVAAERRYNHGIFDAWNVELGAKGHIAGNLSGEVFVKYALENYNAPLNNRDLSHLEAGLALKYRVVKWCALGVGYKFDDAFGRDDTENVLIDETAAGVGANLNGDAFVTPDAQLATKVNRSYVAHSFGPDVRFWLSKDVTFETFYRHRTKSYQSSNRFDQIHHGRNDERDTVGGEFKVQLTKKAKFEVGYTWERQSTRNPPVPDYSGEEFDYIDNMTWIGFQVYF